MHNRYTDAHLFIHSYIAAPSPTDSFSHNLCIYKMRYLLFVVNKCAFYTYVVVLFDFALPCLCAFHRYTCMYVCMYVPYYLNPFICLPCARFASLSRERRSHRRSQLSAHTLRPAQLTLSECANAHAIWICVAL